MKKVKEWILKNYKFILILIAIAAFSMSPYFNNILIYTHDLGYHLNRINEMANNLNIGVFPSLIHSGLLNNLGYANSIFYPELFLYIPAILMSFLKFQVLPAYKFFLVIIAFFTFLAMYLTAKAIFNNKKVGFVAGLLYTFSLYRLTDIFVRGALGEIISFIFIPIIIYGLYECIFGDNKKWWLISIGYWGLANSHVLNFIITTIFVIIFCLINIDLIFKDKKRLLKLFIAALVSVILSIGFFGPMLEQKSNDKFYIDGASIEDAEVVKSRALSLSMALSSKLHAGYAVDSNEIQDCMSEGVGGILLIGSCLIIFRKNIKFKENRFEIEAFILGILVYLMSTQLFPWEKLQFLAVIQFPFRIVFIPTILFTFVASNSIVDVLNNDKKLITTFCIIFLIIEGNLLSNVNLNFNPSKYTKYEDLISGIDHETGSSEYLPESVTDESLNDLDLYNVNNPEEKLQFTQSGSTIIFSYDMQEYEMKINVPLIYYKGYVASIVDDNGNKVNLNVEEGENGHVVLTGNQYLNGTITVEYNMTIIQIVCYAISWISLIILVIYIVMEYKKGNYRKEEKLINNEIRI